MPTPHTRGPAVHPALEHIDAFRRGVAAATPERKEADVAGRATFVVTTAARRHPPGR
jgi:hypothetical protein